MRKRKWKHKKYKSTGEGFYERDKRGERTFYIAIYISSGATRYVTFESWQSAIKLGWKSC